MPLFPTNWVKAILATCLITLQSESVRFLADLAYLNVLLSVLNLLSIIELDHGEAK